MLLPIDNHMVKSLAVLKNKYNEGALYLNESSMVSLGFALSISFVALLFNFLFIRKTKFDIFQKLGFLTLSSLLLTVSGGFLSYFAFFGLNQIRSCNRISIFIAFFALIALCLFLKNILKRHTHKTAVLLIILFFVIVLFDVASPDYNFAYKQNKIKNEVYSLISLVNHIELQSPDKIKVFTLPYLDFPEGRPSYAMYDYELAKPAVYSSRVQYSYGALKGSYLDDKYKVYSTLDSIQLIRVLKRDGFDGILIDTKGYYSYPSELLNLTKILGKPFVTPDNVWIYYEI
jgi:phosphoglycerol transferase